MKIPQHIQFTGQFLQFFSNQWATRFAAWVFTTPVKFPTPNREKNMLAQAQKSTLKLPNNKPIILYEYGQGKQTVLLIHGWCGRATQMVKIADSLVELGYKVISFDAPGHGLAPKNQTNMTEFIAAIELISQKHPFTCAIGHSLGGMALLNALRNKLPLTQAIIIGSGDSVVEIMTDFVHKLGLKPSIAQKMAQYYEVNHHISMHQLSGGVAAKHVDCPVLVIHDTKDKDVPVHSAQNIYKQLSKGHLYITEGLGHRKILGDPTVINEITKFITQDK